MNMSAAIPSFVLTDQPRPRILIIDDSREEQRVLTELLRRQQYQVTVALDGQQGYQRALATVPDLILLDVRMPNMDGFSACRLLKANPATERIPVIFLTAMDEPDDRVAGLVLGGVDYVSKPYTPAEVFARVRIHLDLARHAREAGGGAVGLGDAPAGTPSRHNPGDVLVAAAMRLIGEHLAAALTLVDIARRVGTYEKRLSQVFRQRTGMTVFAYIGEERITRSRQLLSDTDMSVNDIAAQVGFHNPGNFSTAFRERMGVTPSAYRQAMQTGSVPGGDA
jgi:DNA-binding response OmpR family regulator